MTVPAVAAVPDTGAVLAVDRLDAYRVAVEFAVLASRIRVTPANLRDQLDRASASIVLNLAEGVGRSSAADQAHFFAIARGSALECAAVLDLLQARRVLTDSAHSDGRALLVRVVRMTSGLIGRQAAKPSAHQRRAS